MHWMAYKDYGIYIVPAFLLIGFLNLILQTIIMTRIYIKSQQNLKLMIAYHYTITASSIIIGGFVTTQALPLYAILEAIISVSLFAIVAFIISILKSNPFKKEISITTIPTEIVTVE